MGVKDLWTIISPICERKSLWEFQDKCIAIDLSCWICDSQNVTDNRAQPNMYLRNLFFRISYLLLHGILPIFILEGNAPELKHDTIEQRKNARLKGSQNYNAPSGNNPPGDSKKGNRSRLKGIQTQCAELFTCMGVPFVRSSGEAEALCAQLNRVKIASGVISEDSDCFLYGARTVYRNFNLSSNAGASVDVYQMSIIEEKLNIGRNKMIALSLLLGCDYQGKGVQGIGKESALKFLENLTEEEILPRLKKWRTNKYLDAVEKDKKLLSSDPLLKLEVKIRQKALEDPSFPSADIIAEFLKENENLKSQKFSWERPSLAKFLSIAGRKLKWEDDYAIEKFLPVLTRWQLLHGNPEKPVVELEKIIKKRKPRGIASYEISWKSFTVTTIEPEELVHKMFREAVEQYEELNCKGSKKKQQVKKDKILKEVSNRNNTVENSQAKKTKEKNAKKTTVGKGIQTLDKFLVKLNNLSLVDDSEGITSNDVNEKPTLNQSIVSDTFEEENYCDYADTYYYENVTSPRESGYSPPCNSSRNVKHSFEDVAQKNSSISKLSDSASDLQTNTHSTTDNTVLDESAFFRKLNLSIVKESDQSRVSNNVSMVSCNFDHQNIDSVYYFESQEVDGDECKEEKFEPTDNVIPEIPNDFKSSENVDLLTKKVDFENEISSSGEKESRGFKNIELSQQLNDVSMLSCDFQQDKNLSFQADVKSDSSVCNNYSPMVVSPMRFLNPEANEESDQQYLILQENNNDQSTVMKSSTPISKSSKSELGSGIPTLTSGKKTWVSKFHQKCAINDSITASDFECEADDISDLSDIVENIVQRKIN
ncbi:unnamed protein product [Bemisia tabaci]|uniref:Chromo domain-containing protein n=1 Tax=Bemisia tabaci TaxID=7038 RepID=A0A9P0F854_BEMTA|nr:unnamed protein product [Bemisia tabaci]